MTEPRPNPRDTGRDEPDQADEPDELLAVRLGELLDVGADLGGRTSESVDRRLRARSAASLGAELLAVGWWTATALLDGTADPEPTDPEPTDPEPTDPEPTDPALTARRRDADGKRGGN